MPGRGRAGGGPDRGEDPGLRTLFAAVRRLSAGAVDVAGGRALRAGAVPLALSGLVWMPDPARLADLAGFAEREGLPPAAALPPGDPAEGALAAAGFRPVAGVVLDGARDGDAAGPEGEPVGWDRAGEAAALLAGAYDADAAEVVAALATMLASAVADDPAMRIELGGDGPDGARAAIVVYEDADAALVLLAGGPAGRMVGAALAAARGLGKAAWWARETDPDAGGAVLRRWERTE